ncbi:uncharacterized protein LOC122156641 isoform X5 [Centrocercus urophasianus]|uniref:uncharacterized protein LOC122156641 isoform X5 n=1 Tax=Centrocercus urophasianus TaxID=9002 RepID=UPI001C6509B2|nr:uncharacterized protein LOC122156641 isoform X5 [Centrocercus urophasianus]
MLRGHQECLQECKSYMGPIPVSFSKEYKMYLLILLVARLGKFVECDTSSSTASMTGKAKDSWHEEGSREESSPVGKKKTSIVPGIYLKLNYAACKTDGN